jgi:hypothetical protein
MNPNNKFPLPVENIVKDYKKILESLLEFKDILPTI